jgi:hypothetical protein
MSAVACSERRRGVRIVAHGWRRDAGENIIFDGEIPKTVQYVDCVGFDIGPTKLTLGGDYRISFTLTRQEILALFLESNPKFRPLLNDTFTAALGLISEAFKEAVSGIAPSHQ